MKTSATPKAAHYDVILSPVITEKATNITGSRQYTFRVARQATKPHHQDGNRSFVQRQGFGR